MIQLSAILSECQVGNITPLCILNDESASLTVHEVVLTEGVRGLESHNLEATALHKTDGIGQPS